MQTITVSILVSAIILIGTLSCNSSISELEEQKELLSVYLKTFTKMDHPVFHKTLSKEEVAEYLEGGFSMRDIGFLSIPPDSLETFFDEKIIKAIAEKVEDYEQITLNEEVTLGHSVVKDKDIPDHIKSNTEPPPFNYKGFTNVNFISTPIITQNRGIILLRSYNGDVRIGKGVNIYFFIKDGQERSWKLLDFGAL